MNFLGYITENEKWTGDKLDFSSFKGKAVKMTLVQIRSQRSLEQNSYLHAIFNILFTETGVPAEDWKAYFKYSVIFRQLSEAIYPDVEFKEYDITTYLRLKDELNDVGLKVANNTVSTKDLDTVNMMNLIEHIRTYASLNQIGYIMTPEEHKKLLADKIERFKRYNKQYKEKKCYVLKE